MRASNPSLLALTLALAATPAVAALQSERTVDGLEAHAGTIVLSTGERFSFSHPAQLIGFAPGEADGLDQFRQTGRSAFEPCDPDIVMPAGIDRGE